MPESSQCCPRCGSRLESPAGGELCPACLVKQCLEPAAEPDTSGAALDAAWLEKHDVPVPSSPGSGRAFGDYELFEEIGRGGMGVIFRARQRSLNRTVALKMILAGPLASKDFVERFRTEAEAAATLDHPHIVPVYEVGEHQGQHFYTMRLIEGRNLAQELKNGALSPRRAAELLAAVAHAVHHAHQRGVLHRDLKPANILVDAQGRPHVTDFGLAKLVQGDSSLTLSQAALGTPSYMAPEQAAGRSKQLTVAADIYSLGAILFEALTGRLLFHAETPVKTIVQVLERAPDRPRMLNPAVPADLETICLKCLAKEPARRYLSALALAEDLENWLSARPIRARRVGVAERSWLWCRRRPALAGLVAALLVTLVVGSALAGWRIAAARQQEKIELYSASIATADRYVKDGSIDRAIDVLLRCPPEFRHWEWGHLLYLCHQEIATIMGHSNALSFIPSSPIKGLAFDAEGTRLGVLGKDGRLRVWDSWEGRELFALGDAKGPVSGWAFHPVRRELAVRSAQGGLQILDTVSWQEVRRLASGTNGVSDRERPAGAGTAVASGLVYDPAGTRVASWTGNGCLQVWDASSGQSLLVLTNLPASLRSVRFTLDGQRLLLEGPLEVRVLEAQSGDEVAAHQFDPKSCFAAFLGPTGRHIVTIDHQDRVRLWAFAPGSSRREEAPSTNSEFHVPNSEFDQSLVTSAPTNGAGNRREEAQTSKSEIRNPKSEISPGVAEPGALTLVHDLGTVSGVRYRHYRQIRFSPDGRRLVTVGDRASTRVFEAESGRELLVIQPRVLAALFSPDGSNLLTIGAERLIRIWDIGRQEEVRTLRGHLAMAEQATFSPDGRLVASSSEDGVVKVWSAKPGREQLPAGTGPCLGPSGFSHDGKRLHSSSFPEELNVWDADSGRALLRIKSMIHCWFNAAFSPDGRRLVTVGGEKVARIWDASTGELRGTLPGYHGALRSVDWSPDGRWIATGDELGSAKLWDATSGREVRHLAGHRGTVYHVHFDPLSRRVVTSDFEGPPRVWDVASGQLRLTLEAGSAGTLSARFRPDGSQIAGSGLDGRLRVWDARTGRLVHDWRIQGTAVDVLDFSPDGRRLAVPVSDNSIVGCEIGKFEIWDADRGRQLLDVVGHVDAVSGARFSPDGRRLLTVAMDGVVRQQEAFPWEVEAYGGHAGATLAERIRIFAWAYWRERWTAEAAPSAQPRTVQVGRDLFMFPARDPQAGPNLIDLSNLYTGSLDAAHNQHVGGTITFFQNDNDLRELPHGRSRLGEVEFDVRGVIQLRRRELDGSLYQWMWNLLPERVAGIPVGPRVRQLHVLHGVTGGAGTSDGTPIASLVWHYSDGTERETEIVYGRDVRDWWEGGSHGDPATECERGSVVWTGNNPIARKLDSTLRLYLTPYENPRPDLEVTGVDYVSKMTSAASFLVAMTVVP